MIPHPPRGYYSQQYLQIFRTSALPRGSAAPSLTSNPQRTRAESPSNVWGSFQIPHTQRRSRGEAAAGGSVGTQIPRESTKIHTDSHGVAQRRTESTRIEEAIWRLLCRFGASWDRIGARSLRIEVDASRSTHQIPWFDAVLERFGTIPMPIPAHFPLRSTAL